MEKNIINKNSRNANLKDTNSKSRVNGKNNKPLIIGNTKSYITSLKDFYKLQDTIWSKLNKESYKYHLAVPSSIISQIKSEKYNAFVIGAQNFEAVENGASTGANTLDNIIEAGANFIIVGHSETRQMSDSDDLINLKIKKSLSKNLMTILCVGEKSREVGDGFDYSEFIKTQIRKDLHNINKENIDKLVIAYEPLWAVGAAISATSEEAQEAIIIIRRTLVDIFGIDSAKKIKVIYGGSVDECNAKRFVDEATADGVLVGRACMDAEKWSGIVNSLNSAI